MLKISSEAVRIIIIFLSAWILHAEKIHFARYLRTELFQLRSHKVVGESVSSCIDKCKASNECRYINYHVASHLCHLIDGSIGEDVIIEDILEEARGYVFGDKANWITNVDSGCLSCQGDAKCNLSPKTGNTECPVSGCRPPDSKPDAFVMGNMHDVGNKVKYGCTGQLTVAGARQPISTCLESGNWSSTDVQCSLDCGPLPSVANGSVSLDASEITTTGAGATVFCNTGYAPRNSQISCQPSGIWETPLCLQTHDFTCRQGTTWKYASAAACDCVLECSELQNRPCLCTEYQERFILFPKHFIKDNHIGYGGPNMSDESCSALCRDTPGCRSADLVETASCYMNSVMPHQVNPEQHETRNLTLRMCDPCN